MVALKIVVMIVGAAILVIPELPPSVVLAMNPAAPSKPYFILRSHITVIQWNIFWGFIGLSRIPLLVRILFLAGLGMVSFYPIRGRVSQSHPVPPERRIRAPWLVAGLIMTIAALLLYIARIPYHINVAFGDGSTIPADIDRGKVFAAELLTCYAFIAMKWIVGFFASLTTADAIAIASCIAGGIFAGALWFFARRWSRSVLESIVLCAGIFLAGYSLMFFGYVETTQMELMAMMVLAGLAAAASMAGDSREAWRIEVAAIAATSMAMLFHAAGLLLLPATMVFLMETFDADWRKFPWFAAKSINRHRIVATLFLIVLPYCVLLVQPFFLEGHFGNVLGGADKIMFVPLTFDYAHPLSPLISYSMFSLWHLADIASAYFVSAPLSIPLLIAAAYTVRRTGMKLSLVEKRFLLFLGVAAGTCVAIPLVWNHDWGMWGDWNIAATYFFPLNIFGWVAFTTVHRNTTMPQTEALKLFLPLMLVQAGAALGLALQLY